MTVFRQVGGHKYSELSLGGAYHIHTGDILKGLCNIGSAAILYVFCGYRIVNGNILDSGDVRLGERREAIEIPKQGEWRIEQDEVMKKTGFASTG